MVIRVVNRQTWTQATTLDRYIICVRRRKALVSGIVIAPHSKRQCRFCTGYFGSYNMLHWYYFTHFIPNNTRCKPSYIINLGVTHEYSYVLFVKASKAKSCQGVHFSEHEYAVWEKPKWCAANKPVDRWQKVKLSLSDENSTSILTRKFLLIK